MLSFLDKIKIGTPLIRRTVFWLLTAFIAYTLFGFFAVPPILEKVALSQIDTNLHRKGEIGEVYFNPLTLHLRVTGFKIANREEEGDLVAFNSLEISPGASSIWELAPVISLLKIDGLAVNLTFYGEGRYSISDLLGSPEGQAPEETGDQKGAVFPFALYGFELTNANITFDDRPHGKKHVISDIFLRVPFTSSIPDKVKEFTQPKFTAVVNGDPIELKGRTLPFDKTLLTEFELGAVDVNLNQYWKYVPIETPLTLKGGRFTSDISLFFERADAQRMNLFLGGGGTLSDLDLADPARGTVFSMKKLVFEMERFSLGDNALIVKNVAMTRPFFKVVRKADGAINWVDYFPGSQAAPSGPKLKTKADNDAQFVLDIRKFELKEGAVDFEDQCVAGGFKHVFTPLDLSGEGISTRADRPSVFQGSLGTKGFLYLNGQATLEPVAAKFTVSGKDLDLPLFTPYINEAQPLILDSGKAGFSVDLDFSQPGGEPALTVANGSLKLTNLAVRKPDAKEPSLTLDALDVTGAAMNLAGRTVHADEVKLTGPSATVVRNKDGRLDLERLFADAEEEGDEAARAVGDEPETDAEAAVDGEQSPWVATVGRFALEDGSVDFRDLALANPASLGVRKFSLEVDDVTTEKGATIPFSLDGGWTGGGWFSVNGNGSLDPLRSSGSIKVDKLGLRPLDGYLAEETEMLIADGAVHANLSYTFAGGETPEITVKGSAALSDLKVKTTFDDIEMAGIDRLDVRSIDFASEPGRLSVGEINLNGPRARVHFDKEGRLNIRRALRIPEPPPAPDPAENKATGEAGDEKIVTATKAEPEPAPNPDEVPAEEEGFLETMTIGKVGMQNGAVKFRDDSTTPAFATELTDMTLVLTDIGQSQEARPKVDFKANIGPTPMSVTGVLNPVISPIYSDLAISVSGLELVPLSPYTLKNLAYPVEKGRLYADVKFKTEDWVLDAKNKFFIEQLKLGRKDKRPDAPNIPVEFGLALLQDSNGNMQLNLPISGRLDDPNFRIGGIVFKAIINLLFKALTSPFSLIGSMFGGGENMDFVVFQPGRAKLDAGGKQKLDTVVKAMTARPKLKLEVDGVIDATADRNGLVQAILEYKIKKAKYESLPRSKRAETTVEEMVIEPDEYEDMLYEAYADEPDEEDVKPTTLFVTDRQPVEVMEKFIRDRIVITDEMLHELEMRRANAVKEYIITSKPELTERVFLLDRREKAKGKTGVPEHRADLGID
ncbi:MAG: DUF748 domain-containing protein [Pseudodesulfovibrio sp.]|uniref:DUF748 domain-containing protein n=1 Tax=Pseudodesulfovibrio sp. TaxID=2035812 RepID=UPI003D13A667